MENILDKNGVAYHHVSLHSAHVFGVSVTVTFRVDLMEEKQMDSLTDLNSYLSSPTVFLQFSNYTVIEVGRGLLDITANSEFTMECNQEKIGYEGKHTIVDECIPLVSSRYMFLLFSNYK